MNPFADQHEWLQHRYRDCLNDLADIEQQMTTTDNDEQFVQLLVQGAGAWRQMERIIALLLWTERTEPFETCAHADFRSWRRARIECMGLSAQRASVYELELKHAA
jgi:hypothetical protein